MTGRRKFFAGAEFLEWMRIGNLSPQFVIAVQTQGGLQVTASIRINLAGMATNNMGLSLYDRN
jgi:hypothetical protein